MGKVGRAAAKASLIGLHRLFKMRRDLDVKLATSRWLAEQTDEHGDVLPQTLLTQRFSTNGYRVPLLRFRGTFTLRAMPGLGGPEHAKKMGLGVSHLVDCCVVGANSVTWYWKQRAPRESL